MIQEARGVREGEGPMVPEELQERIEGIRQTIGEADVRLRAFVEERPLTACIGAMAIGFVVGRIVSR